MGLADMIIFLNNYSDFNKNITTTSSSSSSSSSIVEKYSCLLEI
jgi:hypothetical protein